MPETTNQSWFSWGINKCASITLAALPIVMNGLIAGSGVDEVLADPGKYEASMPEPGDCQVESVDTYPVGAYMLFFASIFPYLVATVFDDRKVSNWGAAMVAGLAAGANAVIADAASSVGQSYGKNIAAKLADCGFFEAPKELVAMSLPSFLAKLPAGSVGAAAMLAALGLHRAVITRNQSRANLSVSDRRQAQVRDPRSPSRGRPDYVPLSGGLSRV